MSLGAKMFKGMVWSAAERFSVQAVQFIIGIILARILTPKEYGIIGILLVFIAVSDVFIDSGFSTALIQKQKRTKIDISTVFWFNIFISLLCYVVLWILAPYIQQFYDLEQLSILLRVLSLSLIINALFTIPMTLLTIELDFKTISLITLIASIFSGIVAVYYAYDGYGVWALVIQIMTRSVLTAILTWVMIKWRPILIFSKNSFKELFSYGSKLLASSLLGTAVNNFYALFIAKFISTKDLGFYTRGTQFSDVVFGILSSILDSVLLPGLSTIQEERDKLVSYTRSILKATALIIIPIFLYLTIIAEPLIKVLITEKWMPAVPIMQIFCIARLITILSGINVNLLYVIGRTDLALKQQYSKIAIRVIFFVIALKFGIFYIALAELISTACHFFINTYYPGKIMSYGAFSQLKDILPIILSGLIMALMVFVLNYFITSDVLKLCLSPIFAIITYFICIYFFKVKELNILIMASKKFIGKS
ncbi:MULTISPECIES: lipopolysaccharide biosynthesis protein [unclassified Arenibacter]|uniref:lipopolysaccharide biosynthesis protein n=1 Tax=unclassified Arenibacter TaxID=2615047 RepID=UPI000E3453B5|nr:MULTISPECIES: lipopolysaccharide biosynthesis protein [unclassified Arenibacter]MCM4164785.1 flippase [Arenibacter sp. A80]RFT55852.1 lipopolysaccharide biosynthesis protein [Arenibacter sp. P308M17]